MPDILETLGVMKEKKMKGKLKIAILIISTIKIVSCSVSSENFPEPNKLKIAIAESIEIPFEDSDTVIYNSLIGICGNSSKDEIQRHYNPQLNKSPYSNILTEKYDRKIWFTGDKLNELMERTCQDRIESETIWDCFSKDKIDFNLSGRAISNNSVEIYERYFFNDKVHSVNKIFEFKNNSWIYKITENELKE